MIEAALILGFGRFEIGRSGGTGTRLAFFVDSLHRVQSEAS